MKSGDEKKRVENETIPTVVMMNDALRQANSEEVGVDSDGSACSSISRPFYAYGLNMASR
jgi:hypothetical protein